MPRPPPEPVVGSPCFLLWCSSPCSLVYDGHGRHNSSSTPSQGCIHRQGLTGFLQGLSTVAPVLVLVSGGYWKMSSDHPAFSFSGDCRRRQWCSLKQLTTFQASVRRHWAEVPQAVVVRPLIQLQLHAALGQFKSCLWIQGGNLPHRLIQRFQQKHPVGKYCLGLPEPDHSVCANCALQMQPPGSLTPWALW